MNLEVLAVLRDEVARAEALLTEALAVMTNEGDANARQDATECYAEQVGRIANAANMLNLAGLERVCQQVEANLAALDADSVTEETQALFHEWPRLVLEYLAAPKDPKNAEALANLFTNGAWPAALESSEGSELKRLLRDVSTETRAEEIAPQRPQQALPEDVTLDIPGDVNSELVEAFLTEGPLQAAHYSEAIQRVFRGEADIEVVNEARRVVHALKGAANTVGVRGVASLTHHLEDILEYLAEQAVRPQGALAKLLVEAADCLEIMLESLVDGAAPPANALETLQHVLDWANRIDRGEVDFEALAEDVSPATVSAPAGSAPAAKDDRPMKPVHTPRPEEAEVKVTPRIRVPADVIDEMLRLSSEVMISRAHTQERIHELLKLVAELRESNNVLRQRSGEVESLVTIQGIGAGQKHRGMTGGAEGSSVFDPLELDEYHELHGAVHGFVETVADIQMLGDRVLDILSAVDTAAQERTAMHNELHELMMRSRMVFVATIEPRLQRTVRQACDATGKQVVLHVDSGCIMLDDQIVHDLIDPLLHLLRNAVGHGIEPAGVRRNSGKPERGTISLSFSRDGNYTVIECADDGAGLDLHKIYGTAIERRFITEDQDLNEDEIASLILLPGFSTSANVSEISGRGVGMDIVNTALQKLKGSIDIQTRGGKGCTFVLRIPMTMGTAYCLLLRTGPHTVAIPTDSTERAVHTGASNIKLVGGRWAYRDEQDLCPVYDLAGLLGYPAQSEFGAEGDTRPVILVKDIKQKYAIVADAIVDDRDLVIKKLGKLVAGVRGVIGTSLLGDGSVVPVLDVIDLAQGQDGERRQKLPAAAMRKASQSSQVTGADILVVDDSLSVRLALTQLLKGGGFRVRTAKDGVEALEEIERAMPAALLLDLEMPRMNGLELTSRLRLREDTKQLPVIMVTSRSSEKHRVQAKLRGVNSYVTKPYREAELLSHLRSTLSKVA